MSASERTRTQVAAAILAARLQRGLTQTEVSNLLNVSPVTVGRWERGICLPYNYHRMALCAILGVTYEELGFLPIKQRPDLQADAQIGGPDEQRYAAQGLYACLRGWMESLNGRSERADFYFTQASQAFACRTPALERFVWVLRCVLVLRQGPSSALRQELLHTLLQAREIYEIDRSLMIETLSRIEQDMNEEESLPEEQAP